MGLLACPPATGLRPAPSTDTFLLPQATGNRLPCPNHILGSPSSRPPSRNHDSDNSPAL